MLRWDSEEQMRSAKQRPAAEVQGSAVQPSEGTPEITVWLTYLISRLHFPNCVSGAYQANCTGICLQMQTLL